MSCLALSLWSSLEEVPGSSASYSNSWPGSEKILKQDSEALWTSWQSYQDADHSSL